MTDAKTAARLIDEKAPLASYAAERDKRLRDDGNAQYLRVAGNLAWSTCPSWRRQDIGRLKSMRMRRRCSPNAAGSASRTGVVFARAARP